MKIAVLLMSSNVEPSCRNVEAFKDTVVRYCETNVSSLNHEYRFFIYRYSDNDTMYVDSNYPTVTYIEYVGEESVYSTFEKTYSAFGSVKDVYHPDLYVRVNISTHINIPLLDAVIDKLDYDSVYCNKINNFINPSSEYFGYVYPRGDFMILSSKYVSMVLENGDSLLGVNGFSSGVDHVDDCLIGVCLCKSDPYYYQKLKTLKYNFEPEPHICTERCDPYAIATRLKTVPRDLVSGYSWDDNVHRLHDVGKFYQIDEVVKSNQYDDVDIQDVICESKYQIYRFDVGHVSLEVYENYLKMIKAGR